MNTTVPNNKITGDTYSADESNENVNAINSKLDGDGTPLTGDVSIDLNGHSYTIGQNNTFASVDEVNSLAGQVSGDGTQQSQTNLTPELATLQHNYPEGKTASFQIGTTGTGDKMLVTDDNGVGIEGAADFSESRTNLCYAQWGPLLAYIDANYVHK